MAEFTLELNDDQKQVRSGSTASRRMSSAPPPPSGTSA